MRLLYVHNGSDLYGASRSLLRLTSRLAADGHAVLAVLPHEGPLAPALAAAGVTVHVEPRLAIIARAGVDGSRSAAQLSFDVPRSAASIARVIRSFRPDLVHTNSSVVIGSPLAARIARVPHVWHVREFYSDFPRLWPYYRRLMVALSQRVICVSDAVARQFPSHPKIRVLHNGFPAGEFEPVEPARVDAFLDEYGARDALRVGIVGRIKFKRKGQETFVRAAALLAERHPRVRFFVIGSPFPGNEDHERRLRALIDELRVADRVILTGDVEDVKAAYCALDVTVLASWSPEPFGGVVIEAMALGRPVVGTAVGGTPEQIADGVTGVLVPPNDPSSMAEAIDKLLTDVELRRRMGEAARTRFLEQFEFEPFYRRLLALYRDVIGAA